jgi:hypothetical protein
MDSRAELYRFLAASAEDVETCCAIIRDNELELVYVELFAAPKDSGAAGELLLVFGEDGEGQPRGCAA